MIVMHAYQHIQFFLEEFRRYTYISTSWGSIHSLTTQLLIISNSKQILLQPNFYGPVCASASLPSCAFACILKSSACEINILSLPVPHSFFSNFAVPHYFSHSHPLIHSLCRCAIVKWHYTYLYVLYTRKYACDQYQALLCPCIRL